MQGVNFTVEDTQVILSPTERRTARVTADITQALEQNALSPEAASHLAGRLTFLTQAAFGRVGQAATKPIYSRAADTLARPDVRAALKALVAMMANLRHKEIPLDQVDTPTAVLYMRTPSFWTANAVSRRAM